ncbi:EGF-like domain-containing protein [Cavenderia fasciculata]|uniref:EGF-like domain-containing protein n=1 Tax=Cavenderia fasciculata TaxID=261658 RepID=F4PWR7_CACFS|nr:EGF-like domain-containing protein [Cavenderia fasciculata]EGG20431.1 EGF-like domain-containing protein [Cavenderia fasciculata]|eukprot:XP_004367414.1 EGF-like domain-containing protein [Cavenderia fasciculata]
MIKTSGSKIGSSSPLIVSSLLLLLIFFFQNVESQQQFEYNDHYYVYQPAAVSYSTAQTICRQSTYGGLAGYLVTITSELEWRFVMDKVFPQNTGTDVRAWLSGSAKNDFSLWSYDDGPEAGFLFYDLYQDRCYTHCPWSFAQPNNLVNNNYLNVVVRDGRYDSWDGNPLDYTNTGYICEFGGLYEPALKPALAQDNVIKVSNVLGSYVPSVNSTTTLRFARLGTNDTSPKNVFSCNLKSGDAFGQSTCSITPNSGVFNVTIIGPTNTTHSIYQFQPPYVAYIYPPTISKPLLTIVGSNFGNNVDLNSINIKFSKQNYPCNGLNWFQDYSMVLVCTPSMSLQAFALTLLPITITINNVTWGARKVPWYYEPTQQFYAYYGSGADLNNALKIVNNTMMRNTLAHLGLMYDQSMFSIATSINAYYVISDPAKTIPYSYWVPAVPPTAGGGGGGGSNSWKWSYGPKNGQATTSYSPVAPPTPAQGSILVFNALNGQFTTTVTSGVGGYYTFMEFGNVAPTWKNNASTVYSLTSGSNITLATLNDGHLFSSVTISSQTVTLQRQYVPPFGSPSIQTPPFYGGPYLLSFSVDGVVATGVQYLQYLPLTITNITRISILGGKVTVTGTNFYTDPSLLTVKLQTLDGSVTLPTGTMVVPHTQFEVQVPPFTSAGLCTVSVSLGGSSQIASTYLQVVNPAITEISVAFGPTPKLILTGVGFQILTIPPVIMFGNGPGTGTGQINQTQLLSYSDTEIEAYIPYEARQGNFSVAVGPLTSQLSIITLSPYIMSVGPSPSITGGSSITVTGRFLANTDTSGTPLNLGLSVSKNGIPPYSVNCTSVQGAPLYQLECPIAAGTGSFNATLVYSSIFTFKYQLNYQYPTIDLVSSIDSNSTGLVSIVGSSFASVGVSVLIGNTSCSDVSVFNSTYLTCTLNAVNSNLSNTNGMALPVRVEVDGLVTTKNMFFFNIYKLCLPQCDSQHGTCNNKTGRCDCQSGYTGYNCSTLIDNGDGEGEVIVKPPVIGESGNSFIPGTGYNFSVSLSYLREVDMDNQPIKTLPMSDIKWTNRSSLPFNSSTTTSSSIASKERFEGHFPNDTCSVQLDLTIFSKETIIYFAGEPITMPTNSIKYEITIYNWTFSGQVNSLEAIYSAITDKQTEYQCEDQETSFLNDQNDNISWFEIYAGGATMHAKFADRVIVDDRYYTSRVSILPSNDQLYNLLKDQQQQQQNNAFQVLAAITVPNFANQAIIDPNFGSLIKFNSNDCGSEKNQWKVPVIVVCSVVGAAALICITIFIVKKNYTLRKIAMHIKMSARSSS